MTDEYEELRETMARIREEAKGLLGNYGDSLGIMSELGDPRHNNMQYPLAAHVDDEGCDEGVSFRRVEIPGSFDTDPGHDDFSQPKQDINALLYSMMDLIDSLRRVASPELVKDGYAELLEKTHVAGENYHSVAQHYWPASENNDIAKHLFDELKIEIERMRAEASVRPAPSTQP